MARPNPQDPLGRKRADPAQEQEEEKELDGAEKDANESEQKQNSEQNTMGNAALQSQMISTDGGDGPDGGGGGAGLSVRRADLEAEQRFGGDGDGDGDLPLTLEDLVRSWNPGTPKTKDRPSWLEPMPSDELPAEDAAYLAEIRSAGPRRIEAGFTLDAQLQPSRAVVAASVLGWMQEGMGWCGQSLLERSMAHVLAHGSSFIQDPWGRVLLSRARMAAITTEMLQASPLLTRDHVPTADLAMLRFCLELAGHARHAEMVRIDPGVEGKQMPKTPVVFDRSFEGPPREVTPRALPEQPMAQIRRVLTALFDMEDPAVYLPALQATPQPEEDDPLGLDAILAELTGGAPDPEEPLYYSALQAAERIAASTARTRIHAAATAVAIAQVARQYSSGAPTETLRKQCKAFDAVSDKSLRLLVEIARAAQKRSVPPRGLKAGLTRATRGLRKVHGTILSTLAEVVGGVLPGEPGAMVRPEPVSDPLTSAWLDGRPGDALGWMASLPQTPENRAASLLTQAAAGEDPRNLGPAMAVVADELGGHLGRAMHVFASPCLLAGEQLGAARASALERLELAARRRNGVVLADAALTAMEATPDLEQARELWREAGTLAYSIGAPGALTMLARYRPGSQADVA